MGLKVSRAEGIYIYDENGKPYMDMIAGLAVSNIGHGNPEVLEAIKKQTEEYLHVMVYGEFYQETQLKLAKLLSDNLPEKLDTCYFVNSGTEAVEAALKLAKRVSGKSKIISFRGAYHGSSHGSLSVSGNEVKKQAFRPLLPNIEFIEHNNIHDLAQIDNKTAAVILETIQGDAGIRIPDKSYMLALREACDKNEVLLILDEIQAGMGRTGKLWAFEHFGIDPDILCLGKALGGGMPIGALVANRNLMEQFTVNPMLGHITTFGGHPLVCAAAYAGLKFMLDNNIVAEVEAKATFLHDKLIQHSLVKAIRHKGLFFAIEMDSPEIVQKVVEGCMKKGLISFWFLSCPQAFRLAPPLTISYDELTLACDKMLEVFEEVGP